jgi:hypothetical protein
MKYMHYKTPMGLNRHLHRCCFTVTNIPKHRDNKGMKAAFIK